MPVKTGWHVGYGSCQGETIAISSKAKVAPSQLVQTTRAITGEPPVLNSPETGVQLGNKFGT